MLLLYFPVSNADARYWKHLIGLFVAESNHKQNLFQ